MSADLSTTYLGFRLKNPLVISACPLTAQIDQLRRLQEAGAAAAVLPSLFEEQIEHEADEIARVYDFHTDSFAESLTYFPEEQDYVTGPEEYLRTIAKAKKAVDIPIIASLNGTNKGGWIRYAKRMQDAGADALELNIYLVAADAEWTGRDVESRYLDLVAAVKQSISIPLAVKLGPYFSAVANMGVRLAQGAQTAWCCSIASSNPTSISIRSRCTRNCTSAPRPNCSRRCVGSPFCRERSTPRWPPPAASTTPAHC